MKAECSLASCSQTCFQSFNMFLYFNWLMTAQQQTVQKSQIIYSCNNHYYNVTSTAVLPLPLPLSNALRWQEANMDVMSSAMTSYLLKRVKHILHLPRGPHVLIYTNILKLGFYHSQERIKFLLQYMSNFYVFFNDHTFLWTLDFRYTWRGLCYR